MSGGVEGAGKWLYETVFPQSGGWERCSPENQATWIAHAAHVATLTAPPARTYAEGVEDAAKICDERAAGRARMYEDNQAGINAFKAVEAEEAAAAIRLLSQGEKA